MTTVRIVLISDNHRLHRYLILPEGDILIHAGDLTAQGQLKEVIDFNDWLGSLRYEHKIVIAGNHDICIQQFMEESLMLLTNCIYLQDSEVSLFGLKFYGSPWQPPFYGAFNAQRGAALKSKWDLIPPDTDVLITHSPPLGVGDTTASGRSAGCEDLLKAAVQIQPKLHVFGHIHEGAGLYKTTHTTFVNACSCDEDYNLVNSPIVMDLEVTHQ